MAQNRLLNAFELFDAYNKKDPNKITWEGVLYPAEYFYAIKLYDWVQKLQPEAGEALLLASRCQHIGRWEVPRDTYPQNKAGYLNWRSNLGRYHAQKAAQLLFEAGYSETEIEEVKTIVLKQQIKTDPRVQTIEDALCLVFLEFQYEEFIGKHEDAKVVRILQKTWAKMSEAGHHAALGLKYSDKGFSLIKEALGLTE
ncbi:DUF4202 domain-containing protein [Desertivirga xinjiangensis]|uniref:DUF4202 domain-containing protein n=1 Tax=Desertivirga xinjiangensis TaxID=539206 RepID=UPI00210AB0E8|nr:DUF4202 domain-containing protein [Pedobacter xinjiangensis]